MKIPPNVKTLEFSNSILWLDEHGILYSQPKSVATQQTMEEMKAELDKLQDLIGTGKVCMVLESNNNSKPPTKEERDYIAAELARITRAMAIVTNSPLSRMIANLFFGLKPPPYPVKMFSNENEAREWVKQYL